MPQMNLDSLVVGLSEAEKDDLERMISEFRCQDLSDPDEGIDNPLKAQLDSTTQKLNQLTKMVLKIDRQMAALVEVIGLSHQKSELLNQRLDAVIAALKKGHKL